jgi:hypothetical protein
MVVHSNYIVSGSNMQNTWKWKYLFSILYLERGHLKSRKNAVASRPVARQLIPNTHQ